jgi:predicted ATPase/class 3 adenylate cyclase/Flp pilus assembly protein TadD
MGAPEATVTFLFTDIEGSTELWERHGADMAAALARHDAIVRDAIEHNGGHVFKALGDAFYAVFVSAPDAVAAAVQGQRALIAESWPLDGPLKVRMAVHSGTAERRGDDWFGPPLNRAARMLDAGHGGQILLSQAVEWLVANRFPEGSALRDLGERTLKDLARPERIFQLVAEDLPDEFPPLHTLDARPHNLPVSPTALVGREEEIAAVRGLFLRERARLVTLLGPGGTGKTRLGLQVAAELIDAFQHGVFLVNFAPVQDPALVPAEILQALGEKPADDLPPAEALRRFVRERQILLVLDNFEQLVPAASFVGELLREAPDLALLVTSQAALHVRGEREFPVSPLPVPASDMVPDPAQLLAYDAVALFVERARAALPSFDLTPENAAAVATITRQLDGLPLALELAAARVKMFPPEALAARLLRTLDFLTTGARDLPDRQRTLRGAIEWSYGLLSDEEKALFQRQAVFDGGFTLEAAEAVCSAPGAELDVMEGLTSLLDKSLIRQTRTAGVEPRFERLRTIRAFAVEKLDASGSANLWRRRHAVYFAEFASGFNPTGAPTAEVRSRLDRLQQELENLRAAFGWAIDHDEATLAVQLCNVLPALWFVRGSAEEGQRWVDRVLGLGVCLSDRDRMIALGQRGRLAQVQGDNSPRVVADFEESLALARELGDEAAMARAMMSLGNIHSRMGEHDRAEELFRESLEVYRRVGESFGEGGANLNLGDLYLARGEIARAREYFERAVALARQSGDPVSLAFGVSYLGDVAYEEGDMIAATARYEESLAVFRDVGGGEISQAWLIADLGAVARETGQLAEARTRFEEALRTFCERVYRPGIAHGLVSLASVDALEGNADRAARLLGASEALRKQATITRIGSELVARRIILEQGRAALSDEAFEALRAQGAELSIAEALALAGVRE